MKKIESNSEIEKKEEREEILKKVEKKVEEEKNNDLKLQEKKKKKKNIIKYISYLFIILILTAIVLGVSLTQPVNEEENALKIYEIMGSAILEMNYTYLIAFIALTFIVFSINALILFLFARLYQKHYRYHQALANQAVGIFYSNITPGSSGGQFAQVYTFSKQGVAASSGASIFVMSYIIYQSVLIGLGFLSVITKLDLVMSIPALPLDIQINGNEINIPIVVFVILGFALNALVIVLLFFMSYSRTLHNFVINHFLNFLGKIKLVKNVDEKKEMVRIQVENFRIELRRLQTNAPFTILVIFLTLLSCSLQDCYPLFAGLCFNGFEGVENVNMWNKIYDSIVLTNFHQMITGLIPLPGSAGISEIVFERLFGQGSGYFGDAFYNRGGTQLCLLLWRFMTFYIPFLLCGIVAATYKSRGVRIKDRFYPAPDRKTMVTLQFETYEERKNDLKTTIKEINVKKEENSKFKNKRRRKNILDKNIEEDSSSKEQE